MTSILSDNQRRLLTLLSEEVQICQSFYLSGGTALAEFYLQHRLSEDLDFFSEEEFESEGVSAVLKKIGNLSIDSLIDIAVNKVFTIYQKPRSRDYIDLYCIMKRESWTIADLVRKARIKFDYHIDPLQLGAQFVKAQELKDYPRMLILIDDSAWQGFFLEEAKRLSPEVLM